MRLVRDLPSYLMALFCLVFLAIVTYFVACNKPEPAPTSLTKLEARTVVLPQTPRILDEKKSPVPNVPKARTPYVPPEGHITITPKDPEKTLEEVVNVVIKDRGITFTPGVHYAVPDRLGADIKLAYRGRLGLGAGANVRLGSFADARILGYASYRLDRIRFVQNTEAFVGYTNKKEVQVGLRINF